MEAFAELFEHIDQTTSTNEKVRIMTTFFRRHDADTNAWVLFFLSGQKPKKLVGAAKLRQWSQKLMGYPDWMMEECYAAVGDTAEMVSLTLAAAGHTGESESSGSLSLGDWMTQRLLPLAGMNDDLRHRHIVAWWEQLQPQVVFILNKLLTGSLRVGVSETLVYRSLAEVFGLPHAVIASRLVGSWSPSGEFFTRLGLPDDFSAQSHESSDALLPLPFCLAAPLDGEPEDLGEIGEWQCEWKWDGIRCQLVKRGSRLEIWSRGEERITSSFPDLVRGFQNIPGDWIVDGEIVAGDWRNPASFHTLQKRLNRKNPSAGLLASNPVSFLAYDILQSHSDPWRHRILAERRLHLEQLLTPHAGNGFGISPVLAPASWADVVTLRSTARSHGAEGVMIKSARSHYETGRKRGIWYKWKTDPLTIDAVLTAAQPGTGRRASLYTDYTFSLWNGEALLPVAKAYSGLTDTEIRELDRWIRNHTTERFGPIRMVKALRVFEIGFEGIGRSERHKSGYAVRFPRILRERTDKPAQQANRLEDLTQLFESADARPTRDRFEQTRSVELLPPGEQMSFDLVDEEESA